MISVVVWLWRGTDPRRVFLAEHVNTLARAFRRTLSLPHRFVCVTDDVRGFSVDVDVVLTPPAAAVLGKLQNPEGSRFPSCYRRLWNFAPEAGAILGERILAIDVDLVVVQDLAPLLLRTEPFVGWRPLMQWGNPSRIGGGMYLLTAGAHPEVYADFQGPPSIAAARRAGFRGSDQAWLSYKLGRTAYVWSQHCSGLYSIRDLQNGRKPLPADARLVQFNGPQKPWSSSLEWVKEYWH